MPSPYAAALFALLPLLASTPGSAQNAPRTSSPAAARTAALPAPRAAASGAAPAAHSTTPLHPWVVVPPQALQPENYFANLRDGQEIETPFVLKFGLSRFGLAGLARPIPKTGHHHLLVNRDLPLDFNAPLPFNDQYIHFGKGQMETVLTFKPGDYTLRMLLANDKHIPYFIYSAPIRIKVKAFHKEVDPKSLLKPGIAILTPQDATTVEAPVRVLFHASGYNISHAGIKENEAGHFVLDVEGPGGPQRMEFRNGWTEAWVRPTTPGSYVLKLSLLSNATPGKVLATAAPVRIKLIR